MTILWGVRAKGEGFSRRDHSSCIPGWSTAVGTHQMCLDFRPAGITLEPNKHPTPLCNPLFFLAELPPACKSQGTGYPRWSFLPWASLAKLEKGSCRGSVHQGSTMDSTWVQERTTLLGLSGRDDNPQGRSLPQASNEPPTQAERTSTGLIALPTPSIRCRLPRPVFFFLA